MWCGVDAVFVFLQSTTLWLAFLLGVDTMLLTCSSLRAFYVLWLSSDAVLCGLFQSSGLLRACDVCSGQLLRVLACNFCLLDVVLCGLQVPLSTAAAEAGARLVRDCW